MQPAETHTVGGNRGEEPEQKYEEVSSMKKRGYVEMRYYDVPQKEWVLALLGQEWVRAYGEGIRQKKLPVPSGNDLPDPKELSAYDDKHGRNAVSMGISVF